ncbi:MAG: hypothetical protein PVH12_00060 [Candidatus Bathyarchaeota archaeon]|jgi:hypothetical protein
MKTAFSKRILTILFLIFLFLSFPITINRIGAALPSEWWDPDWRSYIHINLTETLGIDRIEEPVDAYIVFNEGTCLDPDREIRVMSFDGNIWSEVPSQVYNITYRGTYATSCNVVFMANCAAYSTVTYYIYYNNRQTTHPAYDGLRLHEEAAGDTYNITVMKEGIEKRYFRIFWKKNVDLYCDGLPLAHPGGQAGWEFSQMSFSALWEDDDDNPWFSSKINEVLEVVRDGEDLRDGPLFVDFYNEQPVATDLWGMVFNFNVSTSYTIRVYYRQNLNPLIKFRASLSYKEDAVTNAPWFFTTKLANGTSPSTDVDGSYNVYEHLTFMNTSETTSTIMAETEKRDVIWSPSNPVGWWSFNGSRPESDGKPAANVGLIPIDAGGTNEIYNYAVHFNSQIENNDNEAWFFLGNITAGSKNEVIETTGFINTYPLNENAEPTMTTTANELRNPLVQKIGGAFTKLLVKTEDYTLRPYQDIINVSAISDGSNILINVTLNGAIPEIGWRYLNIYLALDTETGGNYWFLDDLQTKYPEEYPYAWEYFLKIYDTEDFHLFNVNSTDLGPSNITVATPHDNVVSIVLPLQSIGHPSTLSMGIATSENIGIVKDTLGPGVTELVNGEQTVLVTAWIIDFATAATSSISETDLKLPNMGVGRAYWDLIDVWHGLNTTHLIVYTSFSNLTGVNWKEWRLSIAIDIDHKTTSGEPFIAGFSDSRIGFTANTTFWEYCCIVDSPSDIFLAGEVSNVTRIEEIKATRFGNMIMTSIPLSFLPGLVTPSLTVVSGSDRNDTAYNFAGTYAYDYEETLQGAYMISGDPLLITEDRIPPTILEIVPAMRGQEIFEDLTININASVVDNPGGAGVDIVVFKYSTDGGIAWETINMTQIENNIFTVTAPKLRAVTTVTYAMNATDKAGNHVVTPNYWYKIVTQPGSTMWFGLGLVVGAIVALFIAATIAYARKKT